MNHKNKTLTKPLTDLATAGNEILGITEFYDPVKDLTLIKEKVNDPKYCYFGKTSHGFLGIPKTAGGKLSQLIWSLFYHKKEIPNASYIEKFEQDFLDFFCELKTRNKLIDKNNLESFFAKLLKQPTQVYTAISNIYGVQLVSDTEFQLNNNFSIITTNSLVKSEYGKNPRLSLYMDKVKENDSTAAIDHFYFIYKNIIAVDSIKAKYLLTKKFEAFINVLLYCAEKIQNDNAKISFCKEFSNSEMILFSSENNHTMAARNDLINPIYQISDRMFKTDGNRRELFHYIEKEEADLDEMELKIRTSVNWIGKSLKNPDISEGFLYLCIAAETLLLRKENQGNGISNRLAEYMAFLAGSSLKERMEIFQQVKDLYDIRSILVHSGSGIISMQNYYDLLNILKSVIAKLFELKDAQNLKTVNELASICDQIRFS